MQTSLAPWKNLLNTYSIAPLAASEEAFKGIFGSDPSLVLVRPDGYAAFLGSENSLDALARYLDTWFPTRELEKQAALILIL